MALEVNRQNPSAFSLSMKTLQGVSGKVRDHQDHGDHGDDQEHGENKDANDERIASASDRLYGKTNNKQKKAGKLSRPAYRYRLIKRKGFRACEVSTQKQ